MAKIFVMPQAQVITWDGVDLPNVDEYSYRNVEGHGADKAFRYEGFETSHTDNPLVTMPYESDTYLRFEQLVTAGDIAVGDKFLLGIGAPELTELDTLWVRQRSVLEGFKLKVTLIDGNYETIEDEGIEIDFSNACVDGRWVEQPVQKYRYDNSADLLANGENEIAFLVAEIVEMPEAEEWFGCEGCNCGLPLFDVRVHYNDSCLLSLMDTCAPQDVYDAWVAAVEALSDEIVIFADIKVNKSKGGWSAAKKAPAPASAPEPAPTEPPEPAPTEPPEPDPVP